VQAKKTLDNERNNLQLGTHLKIKLMRRKKKDLNKFGPGTGRNKTTHCFDKRKRTGKGNQGFMLEPKREKEYRYHMAKRENPDRGQDVKKKSL